MSSQKQTILTEEGLQKLENELEELKGIKRKEIAEKIISCVENKGEYDEAKNEQAIMEARILELETMLKNVKVIDEHELSTEIVHVGSKIKVYDVEFDEECEYKIVGSNEADPLSGRISDESPVGAALLGHKVGEQVSVETPSGVCEYKILEISK